MKRLLAVLPFVCAASVQAAPHLFGNVDSGVTHCGMVLDGASKVTMPTVPAAGGNPVQCKFDLATINAGPHTVTLTAIINDPVWGTQESAPSVPFSFTKPAAPATPTTLRLGI